MTNKPPFAGEGARRVRLGDVCKLSKVRNRDGLCTDVYSVTNSQGFIPSVDYFNKEVFSNELRSYRVVERGMLAYNPSRINVGSIALQNKADCVVVSPLYVVFSVDERRVLPEYLLSFLKCGAGLSQISANSIGTVRNNLKFEGLCNITIVLPSLEAQRRRVLLMREIDRLVRGARSQLSLLDGLVKSRFVEMFGDPSDNSRNYQVVSIGEILSVQPSNGLYKPQKDYVTDGSGVPIIRIDSFNEEGPNYSALKRLSCTQKETEKYGLRDGDIVVNRVNSIGCMGKTMLIDHLPEVVVFESNMMRMHVEESTMFPRFLRHQMTSDYAKHYFESHAKKAIGQASINQADVKGLKVLVPPYVDQKSFLDFAAEVDKSRVVVQMQIEKLQTLYDSLAQEYFG